MITFQDLQNLCTEVAPEVPRVHVADSGQWREFNLCSGFLAMTSPGIAPALWPAIAQGYMKNGPAVLLNCKAIGHHALRRAAKSGEPEEVAYMRSLAECTLHELGHIVDRHPPYHETDLNRCPGIAALTLCAMGVCMMSNGIEDLKAADIHSHSPRWCRLVAHLVHRAGGGLCLSEVLGGKMYGLPSGYAVRQALGEEPERMRGWSFEQIKETPAPSAFTQLFERQGVAL